MSYRECWFHTERQQQETRITRIGSDDPEVFSSRGANPETKKNGFGFRGVVWNGLEAIRVIRPLIRMIRDPGCCGIQDVAQRTWVRAERQHLETRIKRIGSDDPERSSPDGANPNLKIGWISRGRMECTGSDWRNPAVDSYDPRPRMLRDPGCRTEDLSSR